jgi:hypothetical protein
MEVEGRYWRARPGTRGHVFPANRASEGDDECGSAYPRLVVCSQNEQRLVDRDRVRRRILRQGRARPYCRKFAAVLVRACGTSPVRRRFLRSSGLSDCIVWVSSSPPWSATRIDNAIIWGSAWGWSRPAARIRRRPSSRYPRQRSMPSHRGTGSSATSDAGVRRNAGRGSPVSLPGPGGQRTSIGRTPGWKGGGTRRRRRMCLRADESTVTRP